MISSLVLLSVSTFATPVVISEVRATREAGHLRVEVRGDGGIDPEDAHTQMSEGRLLLFMGGTRVRADNRAWSLEDGVGEIRAHRHPDQTELDVPLTGNGCSGPVELQGTATGLLALVGCDGSPARAARREAARAASVNDETMKARPEAGATKVTPSAPETRPSVGAANAGAVAVIATKNETNVEANVEGKPETRVEAKPAAKAEVKAEPPIAAKVPVESEATTAKAAAVAAPAPAQAASESIDGAAKQEPTRMGMVTLPALVLIGLAVAAYMFARRRRLPRSRQIQILETASLGPKRSLVVARVGEETLVLGTSEAGITLLKSTFVGAGGLPTNVDFAALAGAVPMVAASSAVTAPMPTGLIPVAPAPIAVAAPIAEPARPSALARAAARAATSTAATDPAVPARLRSRDDSGGASARAAAQHEAEMAQPLIEALADVPEPDGAPAPAVSRVSFRSIEGGLASLFGHNAPASASASSDRASAARFEDILEDSLEDQELRRKLAAGMSTRVR